MRPNALGQGSRRGDLLPPRITDTGASKRRKLIVPAAIAQGDIAWDLG
jgi:hypothetical protein